jgi:hypothetical protein
MNPRPHEALLEDQKLRKAQEGHLEEGKDVRPTKARKAASKPSKMAKNS